MNAKYILSNKGFESLIHGHPWIMTKDIKDPAKLPNGSGLVHLGEHWFFHSPMSKIRLRRFGPVTRNWMKVENLDFINTPEDFLKIFGESVGSHLALTLKTKKNLLIKEQEDLCLRWVFSESDLLPGLIIDVFKNTLVCQILTAPVELFWPALKSIVDEAFFQVTETRAQFIELKNATVREKEGLAIFPAPPSKAEWYNWNGLRWSLTPAGEQKTGAYFDQRENHKTTRQWFLNLNLKTAWDLCCFEGGFGLHIANEGNRVLFVDQSEKALEKVKLNASHNKISEANIETVHADIFDFLRLKFDEGKKADCIVLDPPSFVKSKTELSSAMKGYKELNLRALHCINPGGLLVSCACSQNVSKDDYLKMLQSAAHDARRTIHILDVKGPSPDHAPIMGFPESDYLQAWYLLVN